MNAPFQMTNHMANHASNAPSLPSPTSTHSDTSIDVEGFTDTSVSRLGSESSSPSGSSFIIELAEATVPANLAQLAARRSRRGRLRNGMSDLKCILDDLIGCRINPEEKSRLLPELEDVKSKFRSFMDLWKPGPGEPTNSNIAGFINCSCGLPVRLNQSTYLTFDMISQTVDRVYQPDITANATYQTESSSVGPAGQAESRSGPGPISATRWPAGEQRSDERRKRGVDGRVKAGDNRSKEFTRCEESNRSKEANRRKEGNRSEEGNRSKEGTRSEGNRGKEGSRSEGNRSKASNQAARNTCNQTVLIESDQTETISLSSDEEEPPLVIVTPSNFVTIDSSDDEDLVNPANGAFVVAGSPKRPTKKARTEPPKKPEKPINYKEPSTPSTSSGWSSADNEMYNNRALYRERRNELKLEKRRKSARLVTRLENELEDPNYMPKQTTEKFMENAVWKLSRKRNPRLRLTNRLRSF